MTAYVTLTLKVKADSLIAPFSFFGSCLLSLVTKKSVLPVMIARFYA